MEKATRIRYKLVDNVYTSTQSFLNSNGALLSVKISVPEQPASAVYAISIYSNDVVIATENALTLAKAKVLTKVMLKSLGVIFLDEVRNKSE